MKNKILSALNTDLDFMMFIENQFLNTPKRNSFSQEYKQREAPESFLKNLTESQIKNIRERQIIRDNIFLDYKFDIFEFPIVVFFEKNKSKKLKPFKKYNEAENYSRKLQSEEISSLLIEIMNHEIECKLISGIED